MAPFPGTTSVTLGLEIGAIKGGFKYNYKFKLGKAIGTGPNEEDWSKFFYGEYEIKCVKYKTKWAIQTDLETSTEYSAGGIIKGFGLSGAIGIGETIGNTYRKETSHRACGIKCETDKHWRLLYYTGNYL